MGGLEGEKWLKKGKCLKWELVENSQCVCVWGGHPDTWGPWGERHCPLPAFPCLSFPQGEGGGFYLYLPLAWGGDSIMGWLGGIPCPAPSPPSTESDKMFTANGGSSWHPLQESSSPQ